MPVDKPRKILYDPSLSELAYEAGYNSLQDTVSLDRKIIYNGNSEALEHCFGHELLHKYQSELAAGGFFDEYNTVINEAEKSLVEFDEYVEEDMVVLNKLLVTPRKFLTLNNIKNAILMSLCSEDIREVYEEAADELKNRSDESFRPVERPIANEIVDNYREDIRSLRSENMIELEERMEVVEERAKDLVEAPINTYGEAYAYFWMDYLTDKIDDPEHVEETMDMIESNYFNAEVITEKYEDLLCRYHNMIGNSDEKFKELMKEHDEMFSDQSTGKF